MDGEYVEESETLEKYDLSRDVTVLFVFVDLWFSLSFEIEGYKILDWMMREAESILKTLLDDDG